MKDDRAIPDPQSRNWDAAGCINVLQTDALHTTVMARRMRDSAPGYAQAWMECSMEAPE